jgi:hypothetical protein
MPGAADMCVTIYSDSTANVVDKDQIRAKGRVADLHPKTLPFRADRRGIDDRTIECLESRAQRRGNTGLPQGKVNDAHIDLQRSGETRRSARQRCQRGVLFRLQSGDAESPARKIARRAFEMPAQTPPQRRQMLEPHSLRLTRL